MQKIRALSSWIYVTEPEKRTDGLTVSLLHIVIGVADVIFL